MKDELLSTEEVKDLQAKFLENIDNATNKKKAELKAVEILRHYEGDDSVVSSEEILEEIAKQNVEDGLVIPTLYPSIDKAFNGGFGLGELVLVAGFSGDGKTSLCFDMTRNMKNYHPLWLPFEESAQEMLRKNIRFHNETPDFYTPKNLISEKISWIEERILEAVIKYDTKIVFLDNLHFITMGGNTDEKYNREGNLAKQLRKIAKKLDVVMVVIVHLRKTQGGLTKAPTYDDISGSSDIIKVSDKCLILWRESKADFNGLIKYSGRNIISIQKNRQTGEKGNFTFTWDKGKFTEVDEYGNSMHGIDIPENKVDF